MELVDLVGIPALGGGLIGYLGSKAGRSKASEQAGNYQDAINYLMGLQGTPVRGFYGQDGSTGDSAYDNAVRAVALGQLGQQLQAARLNMARGNLTDAQARAKTYAKEVALRKAINDGAVNAAAKATLRLPGGVNNMNSIYAAGTRNGVRGNNAAYANAMNVIANNDANFQVNPAYADALNQLQQGNERQLAYGNAIGNLMASRPVSSGYSTGNGLVSGLVGGLMQGYANYNQYGRK